MRPTTSLLLLSLIASFTASAQVRETPVATASLAPAEGNQRGPLTATDGSDFLVVWNDSRGGTFGTRLTHDGRVLDPTGIFFDAEVPRALLWCGGAYVLVYSAADNRSAGVIRIGSDGNVLEPPRNVTNSFVAAAATNGSTIVLAGTTITVLDDHARFVKQVAPPVNGAFGWALASNGSTYELVNAIYWNLKNSVVATALDAQGHPQKSSFLEASADPHLQVTAAASGYRVFFDNLKTNTITTFATSSDAAPVSALLSRATTQGVLSMPSGYLLATQGESDFDLKVVRGSDDSIIDPAAFATASKPAVASQPSFASAGENVLFVWSENASVNANVRGVILDSSGHAKSPTFDLTLSAPEQRAPAIATGAANDAVVWQESSGIYLSRLTPAGAPLDGRGIHLSATGASPQVLRDDEAYVVAWAGNGVVELQWIDAASGAPIGGTTGIGISSVSGYCIGRDDAGLVLFYTDGLGHMAAQRFGMSGAIGSAVNLKQDSVYASGATAAWNGHEWLVLWYEPQPTPLILPPGPAKVRAERVSDSLSVIDSQPLQVVDALTGGAAAVATDGDDFFIAWSNNVSGNPLGVYGRTVSAAGVLGDPALLVPANSETDVNATVWDGSHYAVGYAERRNDAFYAFRLMLTHAGVGDALAISASAPDQREVALAATPGRPLRAAYTRMATEPEYGYVSRVFTRDLVYARRRAAAH